MKTETKETTKMNAATQTRLRASLALAATALAAALFAAPAPAAVAPAPAWTINSVATPTSFKPNDSVDNQSYEVRFDNIGGAPTDGSPVTITDTLPKGLEVHGTPEFVLRFAGGLGTNLGAFLCAVTGPTAPTPERTVTCTLPEEFEPPLPPTGDEPSLLLPSEELRIVIRVDTPASAVEGEKLLNKVKIEGGGAPSAEASS
jgi:hypothetical protein